MTKSQEGRFLVIFEKVTLPNGKIKTLPVIPSSIEKPAIHPKSADAILLKLEKEYDKFVEASRAALLSEAVSVFLERTNKLSTRVLGLGVSLSRDLNVPPSVLGQVLLRVRHIKNMINYIAREYQKRNKKNSVKYAETCEELVELVGEYDEVIRMLSKKTGIKESTVRDLCKVARMPDEIKELIMKGELPLTTAFMIPVAGDETQIDIARAISGLPQEFAKKVAKYIKTHPDEPPREARSKALAKSR